MNVFENKTTAPEFWNVITGYNFNRATADEIVKEGFIGNELVYSCVSSLAQACATTPLRLMNGDNVVPESDPVYQMFFNQWNTKQGKNESMYQLFVNLFLQGKAYTLKKSEMVGFETNELWVLPTQEVQPAQVTIGYFEQAPYYQFTDNSRIYKYFPEELIILEYYDPSTLQEEQIGLSPLQGVWEIVQASNNRATAEKTLLTNRGIAGFVSPKSGSGDSGALGFTNNALNYIREVFSKLTGGAKKFNKVEVLEQATEFTQLGMDANDMKIIEMQLPHVRSVCRALNLPSQLYGDFQSNTYSNYKEANKAFQTNAVLPNVKNFINKFEKELFKPLNERTGQDYHLVIEMDKIQALKGDEEKLRAGVLAQYEKNLITKKEARELLGFSGEMEAENLQGAELIRSLSPLLANNLVAQLSQEDKDKLLREMGLA